MQARRGENKITLADASHDTHSHVVLWAQALHEGHPPPKGERFQLEDLASALRVKYTEAELVRVGGRAQSLPQGCLNCSSFLEGPSASTERDFKGSRRRQTPCRWLVQPRTRLGTSFVCMSVCSYGLGTASISLSLCYFWNPWLFTIKYEFLRIMSSRFGLLTYWPL